ncbi:MAG: hypothetical protein IV112_19945 [Methyloversatilis discipulorum]|uniref:hypothetical protein n=1 Tax=Methyloversatilis discipulorum TaxID=1119528 RepID=UPI0026EBB30D|nr:hypothetical protein [Methyloversatilis discipulorum]MBT9518961.1 hypothetical protein [Methyloversatilis discipulorum]
MCSDRDDPELVRARIAVETARHYGTMRFAMFTVFSAVLGALLAFAFSQGGSLFLAHAPYRVGLGVAGLVLSVLFLLAEYRISTLVTFYQEEAVKAGALPASPGHDDWKGLVLITMLAPYALSAVFWLLAILGLIVFPVWPAPAAG